MLSPSNSSMLRSAQPMDLVGPSAIEGLHRCIDTMDVGSSDVLCNDRQSLTATTIQSKNSQSKKLVPYRCRCVWFCRGDI